MDAVYMDATTSMTGHGGWPMTCVLDHDGNPFFAGTYFPDQPRHGQPSFRQVLEALADAWQTKPRGRAARGRQAARAPRPADRDGRGRDHRGDAGPARSRCCSGSTTRPNGGFGSAPKFPPSMVLEFLRRRGDARRCCCDTLEAMARGGIYDQLGGGFARYSVDAAWVVPHFEKMLYDNAQLLGLYARVGRPARRPGRPRDRRLPAPRAAHRRGRVRLRAGRRQRGRRGQVLRLDAGSSWSRCSARTTAPGRPRCFEVTDGRHLRARQLHAAAAGRARDARGPRAARRRTPAPARRPRRSGSARPATTRWSPPGTGSPSAASATPGCASASRRTSTPRSPPASCCWRPPPGRRRGCSGSRATASPGGTPGVLEDHGCVASGFLALAQATGDAAWLERATRAARRRARPVPRRRRRLLRHRRRRRGAGRPAARPVRQRVAVRAVLDGRTRWSTRTRSPARAATARPPRRRWPPSRRWPRRRRGSPAGRWPRPRRCWPAGRSRSRSSARPARTATRSRCAPASTPARWSSRRTARATTYPLLAGRTPVDGRARGVRLPRLRLRAAGHHRRGAGPRCSAVE